MAPPTAGVVARADFRRFFVAALLSKAGTQVGMLALPLVAVLTLEATAGEVGLLSAAGTAAFLVIGLPAGAWLDRMRRRRVMVVADLFRGLLLLSVPAAWAMESLSWTHLVVVALLNGVATVFFDIAAQSYLPHLVEGERLTRANSQLATVDSTGYVAGPAAAGWLVQILGAPLTVAVDAVSYLWSAAWLAAIRRPEPPPAATARRSLAAEIRDGLGFVAAQPVLRAVAVAGAMTNLALAASTAMLPLVFVRVLDLPASALGLYLGAGGVGALLGAATAATVSRRLGEGRSLVVLGLAIAPAAILVPLVGAGVPVWLSAVGWAVTLYKVGFDNVLLVTFRQQITPARLLGRVNATMRVILTGAVTFGALLAGLLGQTLGPRAALWAAAVVLSLIWVPIIVSPLRTSRSLATAETDEVTALTD